MLSDLFSFFKEVPDEGYEIDSCHCETSGRETVCELHKGIVTPDDIWERGRFDLISIESKEKQEIGVNVLDDIWNPTIRFSFDNQGDKVYLDVSGRNCNLTEEGFLCVEEDSQGHQFKVLIKKRKS